MDSNRVSDTPVTPAIPHVNSNHGGHKYLDKFVFNLDDAHTSVCQLLAELRPEWQQRLKSEELIVKRLSGGITNVLLVAHFKGDKSERMLFRVYGHETDKIIDRQAELKTLSTLHRHSCAGRVYSVFHNGMSYEFISGETLTCKDVRDPHISRLIIDRMVQLHMIYRTPGDHDQLMLFDKIWQFLSVAPTTFHDAGKQKRFQEYFPGGLDELRRETKEMQAVMDNCSSPIVFCHNDLLPGNILYDKATDVINFIDFEYAGLNYQAYDIGNHFNEFAGVEDCDFSRFPSQSYQEAWLRDYLQAWKRAHKQDTTEVTKGEVKELYQLVQKFTLLSHLLWIVWTLIQAENSDIDFDFLMYGHIRYEEYKRRKKEILG
ncbi:hypothetical protein RvY_03984 [Ramazzottius varieornatus]|uniref:ethanolamine kinase n=1 Tax=Ramazzottius varieornatus TaxID=947166 RepID=A0A1D1UQ06_RAMVA|nr:hypothetical protein RvY_03984 [Ramazzottius varieornatus]